MQKLIEEWTMDTIDTSRACSVCDEDDGFTPLHPRETMMGTREELDYRRCNACDSLSTAPPRDH